ncbi:MAG: type IV toxin-antitoxin system AbiEi family antitoxin domain-containing protein [Desulfomicrobium escambiense]|nr:type IV toxin-antitoxin system AbiEi family antitoxin domain-containing protein [Desulfomicrobium escambiense]
MKDIAILVGEESFQSLNKKLNYYVRTRKLENPRKGIYAKPGYNVEELACTIFTPSYISLEYVLQKAGIVFQYDSRITSVSYLSRNIEVETQQLVFRKIKGSVLVNTFGIIRQANHINIASPERAFLDLLYLEKDYYFDNLNPLNKDLIRKLLPVYQSNRLSRTVTKLLKND